jgi:hypothetical protein
MVVIGRRLDWVLLVVVMLHLVIETMRREREMICIRYYTLRIQVNHPIH